MASRTQHSASRPRNARTGERRSRPVLTYAGIGIVGIALSAALASAVVTVSPEPAANLPVRAAKASIRPSEPAPAKFRKVAAQEIRLPDRKTPRAADGSKSVRQAAAQPKPVRASVDPLARIAEDMEVTGETPSPEMLAQIAAAKEIARKALSRHVRNYEIRQAAAARKEAADKTAAADTAPSVPSHGPAKLASLATGEAGAFPEVAPLPSKRPDVARAEAGTSDSAKPYPVMAYAKAEEPEEDDKSVFSGLAKVFSKSKPALPPAHAGVAVYDIKSATVYMPDGTKLEAHSGLGHMKDNPRYANKRNQGPTPPNIYKLRMREALYHGVEAIRMLPYDEDDMHGRDGFLTHTSLVRGTNGSHGCVAFKNYEPFLKAFKAGKIKTMIVVGDMSELPTYMAAL